MTCHSALATVYGGTGHNITCAATRAGALPFTGLDLGWIVVGAIVLTCLGLALRRFGANPGEGT